MKKDALLDAFTVAIDRTRCVNASNETAIDE